jgi:hypothetical protein
VIALAEVLSTGEREGRKFWLRPKKPSAEQPQAARNATAMTSTRRRLVGAVERLGELHARGRGRRGRARDRRASADHGSRSPMYIVTRPDHNLWVRNDATGWQPLTTSPVSCLDHPARVIIGGTLYVACEGLDHALWHAEASAPTGSTTGTFTSARWSPATQHMTDGSAAGIRHSHPSASNYFACLGNDGALWESHNFRGGSGGWTSPHSLGGNLIDGPRYCSNLLSESLQA